MTNTSDTLIERDLEAPPRPASWRTPLSLIVRFYLATYHRLTITGRDNLPTTGPYVIVSNHASHLDALCLRAALPRDRLATTFTAVAEDYFLANRFRRTAAKLFANAVPFSRHIKVRGGLRRCRSLLDHDDAILIYFPEGTRTRDGQVQNFRPGIGALLAGSHLPVVPIAINGAFTAWPPGQRFATPRAIRVSIGTPRRYDHLPRTRQSHHLVADELRDDVRVLLHE